MSTPRTTVIVTQRERFGMTEESLESLFAHTPGVDVIYVDGKSPPRWQRYLEAQAQERGFKLIRKERYLTPNEARNIGLAAATADYVAFVDNDVLFTDGWLDALVTCGDETGADVVAPLTCHGIPEHSEIHHAGGDYAIDGDMDGFFAQDPAQGRRFDEVMHGHKLKVADVAGTLQRQVTGMCEFHCVLARRSVFDKIGPLDEKLLSTKEHIDFSMCVRAAGGTVFFEPASLVTYVFPCRARPLNPEDRAFFALRWSDAYGRRSLEHFIAKWGLETKPSYVEDKRAIYAMRRMQGILIPMMREMPVIGKNEKAARMAARASLGVERVWSELQVRRQDRQRELA